MKYLKIDGIQYGKTENPKTATVENRFFTCYMNLKQRITTDKNAVRNLTDEEVYKMLFYIFNGYNMDGKESAEYFNKGGKWQ